jgi:hypothetical protein
VESAGWTLLTVILGGMSQPDVARELMTEEERLWSELQGLVDSLPEDLVAEPGYFEEGWSAKDLVAHLGGWLAEAGAVLERIRFGTYRPEEIDIDAANAAVYAAMREVPFPDVRAQGIAARNQMLRAWRSLPESSAEADRWIRKSGPEHYEEHLPRLREWVKEVGAS